MVSKESSLSWLLQGLLSGHKPYFIITRIIVYVEKFIKFNPAVSKVDNGAERYLEDCSYLVYPIVRYTGFEILLLI